MARRIGLVDRFGSLQTRSNSTLQRSRRGARAIGAGGLEAGEGFLRGIYEGALVPHERRERSQELGDYSPSAGSHGPANAAMKRVVMLVVAVVIVPAVIVVVNMVVIVIVIVIARPGSVGSDRVGVRVAARIVRMVVQVDRIIDSSEGGVSLAHVVLGLGLGVVVSVSVSAELGMVVMVAERRHELDCQSGKTNPRKPILSPHLAQTRLPTKTSSGKP